jgi:hypothetical protein
LEEARISVDFNELIEENLILLSKSDYCQDSLGNRVYLYEGLEVKIYCEDTDENGNRDNLIADGKVELNNCEFDWTKIVKWNCRIDSKGIRHESDNSNVFK